MLIVSCKAGGKLIELKYQLIHIINLVGGLEHFLFFHLLEISSSQLTNSIIFQRAKNHQPVNDVFPIYR